MKLNHGLHLACGASGLCRETWAETFESFKTCALAVQQRVCPGQPFAIGLSLSHHAARELSDRAVLLAFQRWLAENRCYVFSINGFHYGQFLGPRVKEQRFEPDWTSPERLAYTNLLFDLLAQLLPPEVEGSVSTLPGSSKQLARHLDETKAVRENLWRCVEHIARMSELSGRKMHLGLEPEPLCLLETSGETIHFFDRFRAERHYDPRLYEFLGVDYDTCHFAIEFEEPQNAIPCLQQHRIKLTKLHLSAALNVQPTAEVRAALAAVARDVRLHQVVVRQPDGKRFIYRDLPDALAQPRGEIVAGEEWRVHFHVPLHRPPMELFGSTLGHVLGALDVLAADPGLCSHLELEADAREMLPPELRTRSVADHLVAEYAWALARLGERGLAQIG